MSIRFLFELEELLGRFSYLGINADVETMTFIELWGVYRHLKRIAES